MLWGCGALSEQRAPPHAGLAAVLAGLGCRWLGLHGWRLVCRLIPVAAYILSGLAIRCRCWWLQLVALVDDIKHGAIRPAPQLPTQFLNNCEDMVPTALLRHQWR